MKDCALGFAILMLVAGALARGQTSRSTGAERDRRWAVDVDYLKTELPLRHIHVVIVPSLHEFLPGRDSVLAAALLMRP